MDFYKTALTHSSCTKDNPEVVNNERLEFLGDSILKLVFSEYLYERFPKKDEGILTQYRARLISDSVLAEIGYILGFDKTLKVGSSLKKKKYPKSIIGDAVEAYIGATYLDQGYKAAQEFILDNWTPLIDKSIQDSIKSNYKAELQDKIQKKYAVQPKYKILKEEGPPHSRKFEVGVFLDDKLLGTGLGDSKKAASQEAAKEALQSKI